MDVNEEIYEIENKQGLPWMGNEDPICRELWKKTTTTTNLKGSGFPVLDLTH